MAKKEQNIGGTERVFATFEQSAKTKKLHPTVSDAEAEERKKEGRTQGAKGAKLNRINFAFTPDNYEFVRRYCKLRGQNMTQFLNHIIEDYRERNIKEFEAFEKFVNKT